ncbi:protein FAM186A [Phyllostomus discolor]|uniref:Protein FAM186A n=1 Tax=Phyllostomus discolor TaxID=89673 RepID=A0A7E6D6N1_9CHIR|nr:protein FAM186A [Phyllostomus discolor]
MFKMKNEIDNESDSENEVVDYTILSRKDLDRLEVPRLEIPISVQQIISKIQQAQLYRARQDINMQLADIMQTVQQKIRPYTVDENVYPRRKISLTEQKKWRVNFLGKIAAHANSVEIKEKTLVHILAWLKEWNAILSEMTEFDIDEHHYWIAQMELLPETFKAIESNVKILSRTTAILLEEQNQQKKKITTRGTLWKSWKERVIKRPATAHALRSDQMISDEFATNTKVSEIQGMLQELVKTAMFNKLENSAIKYISSTIKNLSIALSSLKDELKVNFQNANMYMNEISGGEKEVSLKIIQELSKENEMLQQKLQDAEEKCEQLIQSKVSTGSLTSNLKVSPEPSPQSSTTSSKADKEESIDSILAKEFENSMEEAQSKGTKASGIKWDSGILYTAQDEMTPDLTEEQSLLPEKVEKTPSEDITKGKRSLKKGDVYEKGGTDQYQSQKTASAKSPYVQETSGSTLSDEKGKEIVSETKVDHHFELPALEKKGKERKFLSEAKSKSFTESKIQRVSADFPSTDTKSQDGKSAPNVWDRLRNMKLEHILEKSQISSEIQEKPATESTDKESKSDMSSQAQPYISTQLDRPFEKVKRKGKKHHISPETTISKEGKTAEKDMSVFAKKLKSHELVKPQSRVTKETSESTQVLGSSDGKIEQSNLEDFHKAIMAFLKEKIDNTGKPLDKKTVPEEELMLKKAEVEKLGIIKAKMEEYFQNVAETVTKILRKYKDIKNAGHVGKKPIKRKKAVLRMPGLHSQKPISAMSEMSSLLSSVSMDPVTHSVIQAILTEIGSEIGAPVASIAGTGPEKEKQRQEEYLQEVQGKGFDMDLKYQLPEERNLWKTSYEMTRKNLDKEKAWLQMKEGKQEQELEEAWKEWQRQRMQKQTQQDEKQKQMEEEKEEQKQKQQLEAWRQKIKGQGILLEKNKGQQMGQIQKEVKHLKQESSWEEDEEKRKSMRKVEEHESRWQKKVKERMKIKEENIEELGKVLGHTSVTLAPRWKNMWKKAYQLQKRKESHVNLKTPETLVEEHSMPIIPPTSTQSSSPEPFPISGKSPTKSIAVIHEEAPALGITHPSQQIQALGSTPTPKMSQGLGVTYPPEQAQALRTPLTFEQIPKLKIPFKLQKTQIPEAFLMQQQDQALGTPIIPEENQSLKSFLTLEQAQAKHIPLTAEQAQIWGVPITQEQGHTHEVIHIPQWAQTQEITFTPEQVQTQRLSLTGQQAQAFEVTLTPQQAQALGLTLTPEQAQALGVTVTPEQAQALGVTLTPQQAQALGITVTPEQAQALGVTLTPQQAQELGVTVTPEQAHPLGVIVTPQQAQALGLTLTPEQAQALGVTVTPEQAQALGVTLTPQQAQALGLTLTPEQAQALGVTLTPQQAQELGVTVTPEQAQALGITVTPEQAQALGVTLTPQQAQKLGVTVTPKQAQALGVTVTPEQAQALEVTVTPQQAQELGVTLTPEQAQALGVTVTPEQAQELRVSLTPQQAQALGVTVTPKQAQALGVTVTPEQAHPLGVIVTPQQAQALGLTLTPEQAQALGVTVTPEQAQELGVTLTPQQAQALGLTLTPEQAQALGVTVTPEQAQALGVTLTPQQAQELGVTVTPEQAHPLGVIVTPQQAQALGLTLTPEQAQALGVTVTPEQAQALGVTLTPQQAQELGVTVTPEQAQALGVTVTPEQAQELGVTLTPQQAQALGVTVTPQQAQALGITVTPEQAHTLGVIVTPQQAQGLGLTLTPEQAQALGVTVTPEQAQELRVTLTPQQAQALGVTVTPEQAQALGVTLTPQQAQELGVTLTPEQAQALGITVTPQQAQALGITVTPEQAHALGVIVTPQQAQGLGLTLTPEQAQVLGVTVTPEQAQELGVTLTPEQAPELGRSLGPPLTSDKAHILRYPVTPKKVQLLGAPYTPGQAHPRDIAHMSKQDLKSRAPPTNEQLSQHWAAPPSGHTLKVGTFPVTDKSIKPSAPHIPKQFPIMAPSTLKPFQESKMSLPSRHSIQSKPRQSLASSSIAEKSSIFEVSSTPLQISRSPFTQVSEKSLAKGIASDPKKLLVPPTFPSSGQALVSKGQSASVQFLAPEAGPTPGKLPVSGAPPTPEQPLTLDSLLSSRKFLRTKESLTPQSPLAPGQPFISGVPPISSQIPSLWAPLAPGKSLVPGASSIPEELMESEPLTLSEQHQTFQLPATYEQSPYLQAPSTLGQHLAPWTFPRQASPLWISPTPRHRPALWAPSTPGMPQKDLSSSVTKKSQERLAIISSLKSKSAFVHPSAPSSKVPQAPFTTKKFQISEVSDTSEEIQRFHDPFAMEQFMTFQSYLTSYRTPGSQTPSIDDGYLPTLRKPITSLPSLPTQLPKTSQILHSEWDWKSRFPPINKPCIMTSVSGTKKPKMMVPPSSPQDLKEQRYFVDVEAQRKNLILLNQATKTSGLPSELHTTARNLIIETFHTDTVRLGYLFHKYIAYRLIQRARNNIIKRLQAIQNSGKGYETQNLYLILSRIDDYQKKVMVVWTEKQKSLEQKRNQCLRKMMSLFGQLQQMHKLNLSQPVPLIIDRKQIPAPIKSVHQPFPELIEKDRKTDMFKKSRYVEDQMEAIWNADQSTSSYPIAEKTSMHSLWAQLGGYPALPMLLQLDVQSTFRKSLASIQSK